MSAKSFRDTTFQRHLSKIQAAQKAAQLVEDIDRGGSTLADASAKLLSKRIFDQLMDAEDEDTVEVVDLDQMTLAVARLRRGNVQQAALEARLREMERIQRERDEKTAQAVAQLEKLRDPSAKLNQEERSTILATIDDLLGIKKA
jgi:predicted membrane metal-binding protein